MPLNEREQQILDEIERQFRAEDPDLARAAASLPLGRFAQRHTRLLIVGVVAGLVIMLGTFSFNTILAMVGFGLMVVSATALVGLFRGVRRDVLSQSDDGVPSDSGRNRWPFRR
jgi:hypothetical protein